MSLLNNKKDFKTELIELLMETQGASRPRFDDICVRCPICGDSIKSRDHGHFHIIINTNEDEEPIFYHCFRCTSSGILTPSLLRELGIYDVEITTPLNKYNKMITKRLKNSLELRDGGVNLKFQLPQLLNLAEPKRRYLNRRLGVDLSFEEWINFKAVFNIGELLMANNIQKFNMSKENVRLIHDDYVGFASTRNETITFRDTKYCTDPIEAKARQRYFKYPVVKSINSVKNMYIIPNKIDLMTTEPLEINIAEGIMDILGIYFHVDNRESTNKIHCAVCGSGFYNVCKYFIHLGLFGDNVTINIYSDQDRKPWFYKELFNQLRPLVGNINLIYNDLGKDCGVPKDKIRLSKTKIDNSWFNSYNRKWR